MKIMYRYLSLFLSLLLLTLPAEAGPGTVFGYGNFTGEPGWNATQNASDYYFNSSSNWSCFTAGEIKEYAGEIPADGIVEEITFLTDSPVSELFPVWTADGNYIMYTVQRDKSGSSESYIMKANGSEIERTGIGEGNLTGFSDVNPNGTELILTKSIDSQPGLYLVNLENRTVIRVTDDPDKSEGWGAWCRLGRKIVYTQESAGSPSQLWIVNRDGSNKTRLGTSENVGMGKDWCPLGLKVLYSAKNSKEKDDLWVIDWYGTNQTQLTDTPYGEWNPSFSPDGKRIVYVSDEGGKPEIWIWDIEGNYRVRLTSNIGIIDSNPRWSPEGSKIVFTAQNLQNISNNSTIKSSDPDLLDNSGNSLLTNNSAAGNNSIIVTKNGSDSTLGNSSNNSITNGSEIAVIELESAPLVSPLPIITSVEVDSIRETLKGGVVNVSVTVRNEGRNASEGYIWVSFPDGGELEKVEGTGDNIKIYPKGSLIPGKNGEIHAQYPLVEFVEYEWNNEQEENLNVTLIPNNETKNNETKNNETEEITFFVRDALKNDLTGTYTKDPQFSEDLDQQGLEVYRYSVNVSVNYRTEDLPACWVISSSNEEQNQ